jgi:uncharacterized protein
MRRFAVLIFSLSLAGSINIPDAGAADAPAAEADAAFRSGLAAFNDADYVHARAAWEPLAASGDARAESGLGFMYYSGRGVAYDSVHAVELFTQAGEQGEPTAQLFLALMYLQADGVPANLPLALMWVELAAAGGQNGALEWRSTIMRSLTEAQRQEGWRLVGVWRQAHAGKDAVK